MMGEGRLLLNTIVPSTRGEEAGRVLYLPLINILLIKGAALGPQCSSNSFVLHPL